MLLLCLLFSLAPRDAPAPSQIDYRYFSEIGFDRFNMPYVEKPDEIHPPLKNKPHYKIRLNTVNGRQRIDSLTWFDLYGKISSENKMGVSTIKYRYNSKGQRIEESYWNKINQHTTKMGIHSIIYKFNKLGLEISHTYLNEQKKPVDGVAHIVYEYEGNIGVKGIRYFNKENKPTSFQGVHHYEIKWEHLSKSPDSPIRPIFEQRWSEIKTKAQSLDGVSRIEFFYDKKGILTRKRLFSRSGEVINDHPIHKK